MNTPPQPPYGQGQQPPSPYGQLQPPYDQPPYGQQPQPQPQYGQPMYGPPPGYGAPPPPPPGAGSRWGASSIGMDPNVSAGLGYLIGLLAIIFFFMEKRNRFVRFHTAQAILLGIAYLIFVGLWLAAFFAVIFATAGTSGATSTTSTVAGVGLILLTLCIGVVVLAYMVLWIWGMVAAFSGRVVKFPLIGTIAQRWAGGPVVPAAPAAPTAY